MKKFEALWVRLKDSTAWRQFAGSMPLKAALSHPAVERLNMRRLRIGSWYTDRRHPRRYREVDTVCLLVGHTKSGGTMLGALLDAHPAVAMSDELDVLHFVSAGFRINEILHLIQRSARREALKGRVTARRLVPYSFAVPDQWQGRTAGLRVMGDTKAGITTQRLGADPSLLRHLHRVADGKAVKLIHIVRNPFDPISLMRIRGRRAFEDAVDRYFENCRILASIHRSVDRDEIEIVHYESFVEDPTGTLRRVCTYLGVDPTPSYLDACAAIVGESRAERTMVDWTEDQIDMVHCRMAEYEFLAGYSFDRFDRIEPSL